MARRAARLPLHVYMNGRLVGLLRKESSGAIDFQYAQKWLDWESAIPVSLSLPLREDRYLGARVLAVFDNLLPDNDGIRRQLAERTGAEGADAYSLLTAIGRDCVGALQFLPEEMESIPAGKIEARAITNEEIADILGNLVRNPLGIGNDREFRISLAGAQEKTALTFWNNSWHVPHGATATTHILKPQIGQLPNGIDLSNSVENEHMCLSLVRALGLPAAASCIANFAGKRVLVVERFDRVFTRDSRLLRLPQEDFCQALSVPPTRRYESEGGPGIRNLVELCKGSDKPDADQKILFRAQLVFWILSATDGHAKNFSIQLFPGGRFRLTPLYDVISTQPSADAGHIQRTQMKMAMSLGSNRHYTVDEIVPRHFEQTAKLCGLAEKMVAEVFTELVETGAAKIDAAIAQLPPGFPESIAMSISTAAKRRIDLLRT